MLSQRQVTFSDQNNSNQSITVTICETFDSTSYAFYLWPCAPILSQYLWSNRNHWIGKRILELGAGTSLPGLVAAKIGAAQVILCDSPEAERWFPFIRQTISLNPMIADRIAIEPLNWNDSKSIDQLIEKYFPDHIDLIIGSDIFFHKKDFETILSLLDRFLTSARPSVKFIGTIERRSRSTMLKLSYLVRRWQMEMTIVPLKEFHGETILPNILAGHDIILFSIFKQC